MGELDREPLYWRDEWEEIVEREQDLDRLDPNRTSERDPLDYMPAGEAGLRG